MKVAILGAGPVALEAALRFHSHGAAITWFNHEDDYYHLLPAEIDWKEATSELGSKFLDKQFDQLTYAQWLEVYSKPLESVLKNEGQRVKNFEVVSITKRHLASGEKIPGKSRFHDLFRVIYEIDPKDFINEQKEVDPNLYQRLNEEVVNSLQTKIEMYEDVDLVIDCRRPSIPCSLNISGRALGEKRITDSYLVYGLEALKKSQEDKNDLREVAIIGGDESAALMVLNFSEWLDDPRTRLFLVSHESKPFSGFLKNARPEIAEKLNSFFEKAQRDFTTATETFMTKLREWQSLDDFVQVKVPRPAEPIPRLVFFMAHNASAIDQLIDNKRVFLTLETCDFRTSEAQPENNLLELKTIGVDRVFVGNGFKDGEQLIDSNEVGYFRIKPSEVLFKDNWQKDFGELHEIENDIFKLFTPAESH